MLAWLFAYVQASYGAIARSVRGALECVLYPEQMMWLRYHQQHWLTRKNSGAFWYYTVPGCCDRTTGDVSDDSEASGDDSVASEASGGDSEASGDDASNEVSDKVSNGVSDDGVSDDEVSEQELVQAERAARAAPPIALVPPGVARSRWQLLQPLWFADELGLRFQILRNDDGRPCTVVQLLDYLNGDMFVFRANTDTGAFETCYVCHQWNANSQRAFDVLDEGVALPQLVDGVDVRVTPRAIELINYPRRAVLCFEASDERTLDVVVREPHLLRDEM